MALKFCIYCVRWNSLFIKLYKYHIDQIISKQRLCIITTYLISMFGQGLHVLKCLKQISISIVDIIIFLRNYPVMVILNHFYPLQTSTNWWVNSSCFKILVNKRFYKMMSSIVISFSPIHCFFEKVKFPINMKIIIISNKIAVI